MGRGQSTTKEAEYSKERALGNGTLAGTETLGEGFSAWRLMGWPANAAGLARMGSGRVRVGRLHGQIRRSAGTSPAGARWG
jgi:hypothetical protein